MHTRRLATLLLGAWLAGSFFMIWVATGNFASVERVLATESAKAQAEIKEIGPARARMLLRYHSSEQNRHYFYQWEMAQIALGILTLIVLRFATGGDKVTLALSGGMVLLVVVMHFMLTPRITELGRAIDFTATGHLPDERRVFWNYHKSYSGLELLKIGLGLVAGVRMIRRSRALKRGSGDQIHPVDHADHTHVDR
jgi:hypothetical protein